MVLCHGQRNYHTFSSQGGSIQLVGNMFGNDPTPDITHQKGLFANIISWLHESGNVESTRDHTGSRTDFYRLSLVVHYYFSVYYRSLVEYKCTTRHSRRWYVYSW